MKLTEKLNGLFEAKISDDDYSMISDLLSNDEQSSDKELAELLNAETESDLDVNKLKTLIKKERDNFAAFKYKASKDSIKVIKKYIG